MLCYANALLGRLPAIYVILKWKLHRTRGSVQGNLKPPKFSTGSGIRTFKYRGSVAWNKLPLSIKHPLPPNKSIFKERLNDYLKITPLPYARFNPRVIVL